jgi:HSP20 family protein
MANRYLTPWSGSRQWAGDPLFQLQREIDRVFDDVFSGGAAGGRSGSVMSAPRIDLHEAEGELRLHADLPGIQPSDLDVRIDGDVLTISGERKSEQNRNERDFHVMERSHGRFQRSIQLPFTPSPDEVRAEVRHGVLEVRIPKRAAQERSRRIEVSGGDVQERGGAAMTQAVGGGASDRERDRSAAASSGAAESGNVGQGPGGSSSATPAAGGGAKLGEGGGMAGGAGGPTSVPVGQRSSSSPSSTGGR